MSESELPLSLSVSLYLSLSLSCDCVLKTVSASSAVKETIIYCSIVVAVVGRKGKSLRALICYKKGSSDAIFKSN